MRDTPAWAAPCRRDRTKSLRVLVQCGACCGKDAGLAAFQPRLMNISFAVVAKELIGGQLFRKVKEGINDFEIEIRVCGPRQHLLQLQPIAQDEVDLAAWDQVGHARFSVFLTSSADAWCGTAVAASRRIMPDRRSYIRASRKVTGPVAHGGAATGWGDNGRIR